MNIKKFFISIFFIIIFIIFILSKFQYFKNLLIKIPPNVLLDKINTEFIKDEYFDCLNFDKDFKEEDKENYRDLINNNEFVKNFITNNDLKILITNEDVNSIYFNLLNNTYKTSENLRGLYISNYKLIIMKNNDISNQILSLNDTLKNSLSEEILEKIKDKEEVRVRDIYDKEKILEVNREINGNVFYHEIGHAILDFSDIDLNTKIKTYFYYKEESKYLFNRNYIVNNYEEFLAESISNYLNYGEVEHNSEKFNKNESKTSKFIKELIKN
mgnify:FL=1